MKLIILISTLILSSSLYAMQCPPYQDIKQDANNHWYLTRLPDAPDGTYWKPMTEGPLASRYHKITSVDVMLSYGSNLDRVDCFYGLKNNYFLGIELHTLKTQKPYPAPNSAFNGDLPNECFESPEQCQFTIVQS